MSAQLADQGAALGNPNHLTNRFSAHLALAAGVTVSIHALTMSDLSQVVGKLQPTEAANDKPQAAAKDPGKQTPAATPAPTAAPQVQPQAAAGNAPASTATPAGAQPVVSGSAAGGDAIDYKVVQAKVLAMTKIPAKGREIALATLGAFKGVNGQPVDHGNKLQLADYPAFVAAADAALQANGVAA